VRVLGYRQDPTALAGALARARVEQAVVEEAPGRVYLSARHADEVRLSDAVRERCSRARHQRSAAPPPELTPEQAEGVRAALTEPIACVTGGPGTGKTTMVAALADACARLGLRLALCAPTGRAARRMQEAAEHPAHTLHALIGWRPGGRFSSKSSAPSREQ